MVKPYINLHLLKIFTMHIDVYSYEPVNYGRKRQSNWKWRPFKPVKFQIYEGSHSFKLLRVSKILVTEIISSQRIIYINIYTYKVRSTIIFPGFGVFLFRRKFVGTKTHQCIDKVTNL